MVRTLKGPGTAGAVLAVILTAGCASEPTPPPDHGPSDEAAGTTPAPASEAPASASDDPSPRAKLEALVDELVQPPFGTGAVLCASTAGDTITVTTGTCWTGGPAATEDTRFNVASVSKVLTAAKVVDLAARGRLGLDDRVRAHLPGVSLLDREGRDRAGEVTLRHLLMHRAGLPHQPGELDPRALGSDWTDPDLLRRLTDDWTISLVEEPGTYAYSNVGYALLGAVIERVEGKSFAEVMGAYLRDTLGMHASTFWPGSLDGDAARGRVVVDGAERFHEPGWYGSRYSLPFSGLWATMPDLVRFGRALVTASRDPAAPLHAMTQGDRGHGLGPVLRRRDGALSLEHDGASPGFYAWLLAIPDRDVVLALACNGGAESREQGQALFRLTEAALIAVRGEGGAR